MIALGDRMVVTSETIAKSVGTNAVVVRRVCGLLVKAGLVTVRKGHNGGALLTRPPDSISLGDIYRAVEFSPALAVPQANQQCQCRVGQVVGKVLRRFFSTAEDDMLRRLDGMKLADVMLAVQEEKK